MNASSMTLPHSLERDVWICAPRETVFRFFTDSNRFASWWGEGSRIDPRPGGEVFIQYPGATIARGEVIEIAPPSRIVMTYGYEDAKMGLPAGSSRVTVTLEPENEGTRVRLRHELPTVETRERHIAGWRYQLSMFANVVSLEAHAGVEKPVDRFLALWSETDGARRDAELAEIASEKLLFRDAHSCTMGRDELSGHIAAAQMHMPLVRIARDGAVRFCQGIAVVDWTARGADGNPAGRGINVFEMAPDSRIAKVTGFWSAP